MNITALMPLKRDSERVMQKNTRLLNGKPLFYYVLETLRKSKFIDEIIINTDCDDIAKMIDIDFPNTIILKRSNALTGHHIVMNQLIEHDILHAKNEHILQTHCTNPLLTIATIERAISSYQESLPNYDSLFSVNKIQSRIYDVSGAPINHQLNNMEMTQHMVPVFKENSNLFIFSKTVFNNTKSRIGKTPRLFEMSELESIDIDYEDDFKLAELIQQHQSLFKTVFV